MMSYNYDSLVHFADTGTIIGGVVALVFIVAITIIVVIIVAVVRAQRSGSTKNEYVMLATYILS